MDINLLSNEQLAKKLEDIYISGQHFPRECTPFLTMAKFIKDSIPERLTQEDIVESWGLTKRKENMICPYCHKEAEWVENKEVYGRNYGHSFMCWLCRACNAYVGCHQNSRRPLGTMANKETREWRMKAHLVFDPFWKEKGYTRKSIYGKISEAMGTEIHIAESNIEQCKKIIEWCRGINSPPKPAVE